MSARTCPACGASLGSQTIRCEYCHEAVTPKVLSPAQLETLKTLVGQLNIQLELAARQAVQPVYRVVGTSVIIILILLGGITAIKVIASWEELVLSGAVVLTGLITTIFVSYARRWKSLTHHYRVAINPQIQHFIRANSLPHWQFEHLAQAVLPLKTPLRIFLRSRQKQLFQPLPFL